ncbi:hypothetical protein PR048_017257 [Dryococelus australis]|uniref:C2H2-type domain-containing protein n=1 Tax=Dryococelus australis TaxID=614101 RepID=A0ABQ9H907_9NEOP|nr:hypothetical protein PR048_017257 [Dryococelus australis]
MAHCPRNAQGYRVIKVIAVLHERDRFMSVCGKSFAQQGNLKIHEMLHTGAKPHVCCVCGRRFALRGNLKDHLNIHSCEKRFSCTTCGKAFTQRSTLKEHLKACNQVVPA